jgi:apolipoprotein D and lipocalin family protein
MGKGIINDLDEKNKLIIEFKVGPFDLFPVTGNYNVIETDYNSFAIIYSCTDYFFFKKEYAWVLSRTRSIEADKIKILVQKLKNYTNIENLITTDQTDC